MRDVVAGLTLLLTVANGVLLVLTLLAMSKLVLTFEEKRGHPRTPETEPDKPLKPGTTWVPSSGEQARKERALAAEGDRRKWTLGVPKSGFNAGWRRSSPN